MKKTVSFSSSSSTPILAQMDPSTYDLAGESETVPVDRKRKRSPSPLPPSLSESLDTTKEYVSEEPALKKKLLVSSSPAVQLLPSPEMNDATVSGIELSQSEEHPFHLVAYGATYKGSCKKVNQDAIFCSCVANGSAVVGVCDGHGSLGRLAALLCAREVPLLLQEPLLTRNLSSDKVCQKIRNSILTAHEHICDDANSIREVSQELFQRILESCPSANLMSSAGLRGADYGTTLSMSVLYEHMIFIANVGDSKTMIFEILTSGKAFSCSSKEATTSLKLVFVTHDHNLDDPIEVDRVQSNGGKVVKRGVDSRMHPASMSYRDAQQNMLSVNLSRSLGHLELRKHGMSANPKISKFECKQGVDYIVFTATDGLFDVLPDDELRKGILSNIISGKDDFTELISQLLKTADDKWKERSNRARRPMGDNISATIAHVRY